MAKVRNTKKVLNGVTKRFRSVVNSKEFIKESSKEVEKQSKASAKTGKNPTTGKSWKQGLESSTVRFRKYVARYNKTGTPFGPEKDNLTLTGQLINAIKSIAKKTKNGVSIKLVIDEDKRRKGYKKKDGTRMKTITNSMIEKEQRKSGRSIRGISDKTTKTLKTQFLSILRRKK